MTHESNYQADMRQARQAVHACVDDSCLTHLKVCMLLEDIFCNSFFAQDYSIDRSSELAQAEQELTRSVRRVHKAYALFNKMLDSRHWRRARLNVPPPPCDPPSVLLLVLALRVCGLKLL